MRCFVLLALLLVSGGWGEKTPSTPLVLVQADNTSDATETQKATCRVVTENIVATASASVTRALNGVCATKDLDKHFSNIRSEISNELEILKRILMTINNQINDLHKKVEFSTNGQSKRGPRDYEIYKHNYTIRQDASESYKTFSYFWKIESIQAEITTPNQDTVLQSASFYVDHTYRMYIKLFQHHSKHHIYIHVGLTSGSFDSLLEWPFRLKHRVTLLDQTYHNAEDLSSRVWDPRTLCSPQDWQKPQVDEDNEDCVGFGFAQSTLFTRHYIADDSVVVKLDVFL